MRGLKPGSCLGALRSAEAPLFHVTARVRDALPRCCTGSGCAFCCASDSKKPAGFSPCGRIPHPDLPKLESKFLFA